MKKIFLGLFVFSTLFLFAQNSGNEKKDLKDFDYPLITTTKTGTNYQVKVVDTNQKEFIFYGQNVFYNVAEGDTIFNFEQIFSYIKAEKPLK